MEILQTLGLNAPIIVAVYMATQIIKFLDKGNKLARFYVAIPLVLGMIAGALTVKPFEWQDAILQGFIYATVSAYMANILKNLLGAIPGDPSRPTFAPPPSKEG